MSKVLTVFGATGQQGGSLINHILQNPELSTQYYIRGITRNASKPAALALQARGVQIVEADLDKPSTLTTAIAGSYAVFGVTNCIPFLFLHFQSLPYPSTSLKCLQSLGTRLRIHRNRPRKSHCRRLRHRKRNTPHLVFPPQRLKNESRSRDNYKTL